MRFTAASLALAGLLALDSPQVAAQDGCSFAPPVCAARGHVYQISAYDPVASAVRIAPDLLVTNRHVVADEATARITMSDGATLEGEVVPTSFEGDLILVRADLGAGQAIAADDGAASGPLHAVGYDVSARRVVAYEPGEVLIAPDLASHPFARLHVSAYAQHGNSGGALVDEDGELVGIIASGGEGRTEVVPVAAIDRLRAASGPEHAARSAQLGQAVRLCNQALERARRERGGLPDPLAEELMRHCPASTNRQLIDLAAQAFGSRGELERSIELFELALAKDPGAINTRLGLLTSLHIAGRFEDELPILRRLLEEIPEESMVQRFAIQAGKWGGDEEIAQRGLELVEEHNPAQAEAARRFYEADIPPPSMRPRTR